MAVSRSGMRNPSPISTSSPRAMIISRPAASAMATSAIAAAPLFSRCAAPAAGTAASSASTAGRPRGPRAPVPRSSSTSHVPAATSRASRAATESGARPRLVCSSTPVALSTVRSAVAVGGSAWRTASTTAPCSIGRSPCRARSWAAPTAAFTIPPPSRRVAAAIRGSASTASVRGTRRRGSTAVTAVSSSQPCPYHSRALVTAVSRSHEHSTCGPPGGRCRCHPRSRPGSAHR